MTHNFTLTVLKPWAFPISVVSVAPAGTGIKTSLITVSLATAVCVAFPGGKESKNKDHHHHHHTPTPTPTHTHILVILWPPIEPNKVELG